MTWQIGVNQMSTQTLHEIRDCAPDGAPVPEPDEVHKARAVWRCTDGDTSWTVTVHGLDTLRLTLDVSGGPRGGLHAPRLYSGFRWLARDIGRCVRDWRNLYTLAEDYRDDAHALDAYHEHMERNAETERLLDRTLT